MADFPTSVYSPRTKKNKDGVTYDPTKLRSIFAEDITKLDDEVVALETWALALVASMIFSGDQDSGYELFVENINSGASASAGLSTANDLGNSGGIINTSSGFSDAPFPDTLIVASIGHAGGMIIYVTAGPLRLAPLTETITDKDINFEDDLVGPILKDRTTGDKYRLYMDNGVLLSEIV